MNYIVEINCFYDWLETHQLSKAAVGLWHALMHINNKCHWAAEFTVAMSVLEHKTGFSRANLSLARAELAKQGRISWETRGGSSCATYILHSLEQEQEVLASTVHAAPPAGAGTGVAVDVPTQACANLATNQDTNQDTNLSQTGTINKPNHTQTIPNQREVAPSPAAPLAGGMPSLSLQNDKPQAGLAATTPRPLAPDAGCKPTYTQANSQKEKSCAKKEKAKDPIDYHAWVAWYHHHCPTLPRVEQLTPTRRHKIAIRLAEMQAAGVQPSEVMRRMGLSHFLQGHNTRGWRANFDWLLANPNNWVKVIEGQYANHHTTPRSTTPPTTKAATLQVNDLWAQRRGAVNSDE